MFGPGADTFSGRKVVVIPVTKDRALTEWAVDLFTREGAEVHVVNSGEEHDRFMAITLGLVHFLNIVLGRVLMGSDIREIKKFAGTTFSLQLTLVEAVLSEDPELYYGIGSLNPGGGGSKSLPKNIFRCLHFLLTLYYCTIRGLQ
jgi:prephenate dehydrogenase